MATAELVVAFGARIGDLETSLKRVNTRFEELERSAKRTNEVITQNQDKSAQSFLGLAQAVNTSARAFVGLMIVREAGQALLGLLQNADQTTASLIRLRFVLGNSPTQARDSFNELAEIAKRTGAPVQDLTDAFVRFRTALNSLGTTNDQVNRLVETLANFGRVSGARPQEAANAIIQLGQGLASGRLQGDELKSILENMPALATALAQELGVSVGELRKMGEEGRLTAENVFPALLRAGDRLKAMLNGIPLTLVQSFEVLKTAFTQLIAHIDEKIGGSARLAGLLRLGAQGIDLIRGLTGGATTAEREESNARELAAAQARLRDIREQLRTGQSTRPDVSVGGMVGAPDSPNLSARARQTLEREERAAQATITRIQREGMELRADLNDQEEGQRTNAYREGVNARRTQAQAENREQIRDLDRRVRLREDARKAIETAERIAAAGELRDEQGRLQTLEQRRAQINARLADDIKKLDQADSAESRADARRGAAEARRLAAEREADAREREQLIRSISGGDVSGVRQFEERINEIFRAEPGSRVGSAFNVFVQAVRDGNQEVETLFGFITRGAEQAGQAMVRAGEDTSGLTASFEGQVRSLRDTLVGMGIAADKVDEAMAAALSRGIRRIDEFNERAKQTFLDIGQKAASSFSGDLAGALVDFAATGEQKFAEMAANFTKMVAKMILEFLILEAIITGISAATGGSINLRRRQAGGPVSAGQPYIVGERRPELFVPSSSGYIYPQVDQGGGTVVNVYNQAQGTTTRQQERSNGLGGKEIDIYIEQIVQRGLSSGKFDAAMGQSFGANRRGAM